MKRHDDLSTESSDDGSSSEDSLTASGDEEEPLTQQTRPTGNRHAIYAAIALLLFVLAVAAFFLVRSNTFAASLSASATRGTTPSRSVTAAGSGEDSVGGRQATMTAAATTSSTSSSSGAEDDSILAEQTFTAASSASSSINTSLPPNGKKAGLAGGDGFEHFKDHIGWWYDWNADTGEDHIAKGVSYFAMLWGAGKIDDTDASRLSAFKALSSAPPYLLGFNEPDLDSSGTGDVASSGIDAIEAASLWEEQLAPWAERGSLLGSPAPAKQGGETWLGEFRSAITTDWDFTAVQIYQSTLEGVQGVIDHYVSTYSKPIVVTEWGCVDTSSGFIAVTDQSLINSFVADCVEFFEKNSDIQGYAAIVQGSGLGAAWPLVGGDGELSETGKTYLQAISKYG